MKYNWQQKDWTKFSYDISKLEERIYAFAEKSGRISGILKTMSKEAHVQTTIDILVTEAIKTSEIEGEYLSREDVTSSIRNNLGLNIKAEQVKDEEAKGMATLITDVQNSYAETLTKEKLFDWHKMVFPNVKNINIGTWRTHEEPMQVVSGRIDKPTVHFEAPPSNRVPLEMENFINWFNETSPSGGNPIKHAPIRSAISHLYFETIHPFEDGNGRVGRAIAEKALSQTVGYPLLLSLSVAIEAKRKNYYNALKFGQSSNEITAWLEYFIDVILQAQSNSEALIDFTLKKTKLFDIYQDQLNDRQLKTIMRMLQEGPKGFEGGMTAKKYMRITQTSKATATRDLQKLLELGVFKVQGDGRSTSYQIKF
ncbi:Fic family protein [Flavivirga spongiicola]|uniref:Fic family protein n=1 Tax=Flavivirga spongiicola TaxID=421621 RepID=A0ABU7XYR5_9FLAO|nr:Fic family protein [Flavivirga sp. MEBiC05379]MDO5980909.1 Fic family protein [Flavivirga sp. MEBiC05379]